MGRKKRINFFVVYKRIRVFLCGLWVDFWALGGFLLIGGLVVFVVLNLKSPFGIDSITRILFVTK